MEISISSEQLKKEKSSPNFTGMKDETEKLLECVENVTGMKNNIIIAYRLNDFWNISHEIVLVCENIDIEHFNFQQGHLKAPTNT